MASLAPGRDALGGTAVRKRTTQFGRSTRRRIARGTPRLAPWRARNSKCGWKDVWDCLGFVHLLRGCYTVRNVTSDDISIIVLSLWLFNYCVTIVDWLVVWNIQKNIDWEQSSQLPFIFLERVQATKQLGLWDLKHSNAIGQPQHPLFPIYG